MKKKKEKNTFEAVRGMHVVVKEGAGQKNKWVAKAEPLKNKICGRENCFPFNSGGGNYQKNSSGYRVTCFSCQRAIWKHCLAG